MIATHTQTFDLFQEQVQLVPYVSTDLRMVELTAPDVTSRDIIREDIPYRRLDADYFVWIEQTVSQVQKAHAQGRIPQKAYSGLMNRYRVIQKWTEDNICKKDLDAARKRSSLAEYSPPQANRKEESEPESRRDASVDPRPYLYPTDGVWEYTVPIDPEVIKIINSIRDEALSKGWSEAALYQNRGHFIAGKWYGLICILDKTDRIEKIDEDIIYIRTFKGSAVPPEGEIVKFPNLNYEVHDGSN